ncbi:MAG: ATP-dependent zinc protease [Magnetococcales bacterium]|nr:ATP-dependent zinc protease [Magnetococcales bacterium]MBF0584143.1 ATP-dependent zinc protease [Magnetococcales bacterium]
MTTAAQESSVPEHAAKPEKKRSKPLLESRVGWREWVSLPALGIPKIKAKMDTGARTSALHGVEIEPFRRGGKLFVRFKVYPRQHSHELEYLCTAPVIGRRAIRHSSGEKRYRYVVATTLQIGHRVWPIELTLTNRDRMGFRLLIGRTAIRKKFLVDPGASFLQGEATEGNAGVKTIKLKRSLRKLLIVGPTAQPPSSSD